MFCGGRVTDPSSSANISNVNLLWRNLLIAPKARLVLAEEEPCFDGPGTPAHDGSWAWPTTIGDKDVVVEVSGLFCQQICVRRVQASLSDLPGVLDVHYVAGTSRFDVVLLEGQSLCDLSVDQAVQRVVILWRLRHGLEWLARRSRRRQ